MPIIHQQQQLTLVTKMFLKEDHHHHHHHPAEPVDMEVDLEVNAEQDVAKQKKWHPRRRSRHPSISTATAANRSRTTTLVQDLKIQLGRPHHVGIRSSHHASQQQQQHHHQLPQESSPGKQESPQSTLTSSATASTPEAITRTNAVVTPDRRPPPRYHQPTKASSQRRSPPTSHHTHKLRDNKDTATSLTRPAIGGALPRPPPQTPNRRPLGVLAVPTNVPSVASRHHSHTPPSPSLPSSSSPPPSTIVYLIRHGESLGQACPSPQQRRTDRSLQDCGLTERGRRQALQLRHQLAGIEFDMIVCSPLTRALQTALLVFGDDDGSGCGDDESGDDTPTQQQQQQQRKTTTKIVVHYDLREIGTPAIPENQPRPWSAVRHDLQDYWPSSSSGMGRIDVDTQTFAPTSYQWPDHHDIAPRVVRRNQVQTVLRWLATSTGSDSSGSSTTSSTMAANTPPPSPPSPILARPPPPGTWLPGIAGDKHPHNNPPSRIAVFCHYHVIRAALRDARGFCDPAIQPQNAQAILCVLTPQGQLELLQCP